MLGLIELNLGLGQKIHLSCIFVHLGWKITPSINHIDKWPIQDLYHGHITQYLLVVDQNLGW